MARRLKALLGLHVLFAAALNGRIAENTSETNRRIEKREWIWPFNRQIYRHQNTEIINRREVSKGFTIRWRDDFVMAMSVGIPSERRRRFERRASCSARPFSERVYELRGDMTTSGMWLYDKASRVVRVVATIVVCVLFSRVVGASGAATFRKKMFSIDRKREAQRGTTRWRLQLLDHAARFEHGANAGRASSRRLRRGPNRREL